MAYQVHVADAQGIVARCAIITLSDTRSPETDTSGQTIRRWLETARHSVVDYRVLKDDVTALAGAMEELLARDDVDAILSNGGTGISRRDQTIDVVEKLLDQPLPGFGELFRMLSWSQIASGAMLSRATAGIASNKIIFAMPGSTKAV
ncbi:MAG: MogA/MoaB family molybdenum cofactor biosynthesis protein, partial [Anaerolineae bacterium]|nr:MogA/MoaB family molybdenum cofactor biosynthesis protein [Phycisphaerae bacterium]